MSDESHEKITVLLVTGLLVASSLVVGGAAFAQSTDYDNTTAGNATPTENETVTETETPEPVDTPEETPDATPEEAPKETPEPVTETDVVDETDDNVTEEGIDTQQTSYVRAIHASPDAPAVDVAIDNETVLTGVEFGNVSDYLTVESGPHQLTITSAEDPDTVVFDEVVTVHQRAIMSFAAVGELSENGSQAFEVVGWTSDPWTPPSNESAISIAHLSPDASTVDVTTENGSVLLANDLEYRNVSDYVTVPPGDYTVEIRDATGTNDGDVITTVNVSLEGGTAYTALAEGYVNPADPPMDRPFEVVATEDATVTIQLPDGQEAGTNVTDDVDDDEEVPVVEETDDVDDVNETDGMDDVNETDGMDDVNETDGMDDVNETDGVDDVNETDGVDDVNETDDMNDVNATNGNETGDDNGIGEIFG